MRKLAGLVILLLLSACAEPLPQDKSQYAGLWQSDKVSLLIESDGYVSYKRESGNTKVSINGPIKSFNGDDFSVGVAFLTTEFKVSKPPHLVDGRWEMVVDGIRLIRFES
ncbi:MAG: hypothetical protein OQK04_17120 [Kangiellaceae bacterium]|nr:hypothetical protein [Kangiellaceae bacterium]MCW9000434.1 hypothetical protein [Kangiellaceae bacterium]